MKSLRLLALVLLACTCSAAAALACDHPKSAASATSASTASATPTTGKTPTVPLDGGCSAVTQGYKTTAEAAAAAGCPAAMAAQCTPAMRAACAKNAAMAKGASCGMHGSATAAGMDHCANAKGAAITAAAAGMICSGHMNDVAHDCSACEDWTACEQAVRALGAKAQVVPLKNGAMIVYTAESKSDIKALQSLVAKRNDKMVAALSAGSDKKLCDECKQLRGAMASGKLHREVVNVERGCMTLITSNDRGVVQKIRAMTGQPVAMR
ncbi:MAG TPA: hypothetical protein VI504_07930 [Candidatus Eisenbacteria bacterium]|jgi:hypothetical protein